MRSIENLKWTVSLLFAFFMSASFGQDETQQPIGEIVYAEYQQNGIDPALERYHQVKKDSPEQYEWNEWELNNIAYKIMNEDGDLEAAEKIFRLNMEEYPEAANPYDSYADYLMEAGNEEEAKKYFKKSIEIAEKSDIEDERTRILYGSKGKLAKLEKKDRQLDFLKGDWEVEGTSYTNGKESMTQKAHEKIKFEESGNALIIHHLNAQQEPVGMRIIAYDAIDEEFDVAFLNANIPQGIETSKMKVEKTGDNTYEMMDSYVERDGKEVELRHEVTRNSDNAMEWVIFEKGNGNQWQKMYSMEMKKN